MSMFDTIIQLSQLNVVKPYDWFSAFVIAVSYLQTIKSNGKKRHGLQRLHDHAY